MSYEHIVSITDEHAYHCDGCGKRFVSSTWSINGHIQDDRTQTEAEDRIKCFNVGCPWEVGESHESQEVELHVCSRECLMQAAGEILWPVKEGE